MKYLKLFENYEEQYDNDSENNKQDTIERGDLVMFKGNEYIVGEFSVRSVLGLRDLNIYLIPIKIGVGSAIVDDPSDLTIIRKKVK